MAYQIEASRVISALADPTRKTIAEYLAKGPAPVGQIAKNLPVSRPAVSQHLKVLTDAGVVTAAAQGTRRIYRLEPTAIAELRDWCDRLWDDALAAFAAHANRISKGESK
ncbi:MAG: ArsR/SmtB family transcription factor [Boseongicola sp.]